MQMPSWKPGPAPKVFIDSFREGVTPQELYEKYPESAGDSVKRPNGEDDQSAQDQN